MPELLSWTIWLFRTTVRISNWDASCTHEASDSQCKVTSRNALLPVLLIRITVYLKSILRYKFLIFDTYHSDTIYTYVSMDMRIRGYFSKPKGARVQTKSLGNTAVVSDTLNQQLRYQKKSPCHIVGQVVASSIHPPVRPSVHPSIHPSTHLPTYLPIYVCLSIYTYISISMYLYLYIYIYIHISISIFLPVYPSIH
jgi:hypothetical protein